MTGALAIEDSPAGIAAARSAGALVLALSTTHGRGELDGADAVIPDLRWARFSAARDRIQVSFGAW